MVKIGLGGSFGLHTKKHLKRCYLKNGAPGENRTHSPRFRKPMLYPVELRGQPIPLFTPFSKKKK